MSFRALLEELRRRDVRLETEGVRLHVDAPAGVITGELRDTLIENKPRLLKLLGQERCRLEEADRYGLIIRWSEYPNWIDLHDLTTGERHEVRASECLPGIVETAHKNREKGETT